MLDDDRWKAVTTVGYLAHPETLKHRPCRSHAVNVTMPLPPFPALEQAPRDTALGRNKRSRNPHPARNPNVYASFTGRSAPPDVDQERFQFRQVRASPHQMLDRDHPFRIPSASSPFRYAGQTASNAASHALASG